MLKIQFPRKFYFYIRLSHDKLHLTYRRYSLGSNQSNQSKWFFFFFTKVQTIHDNFKYDIHYTIA